jgi:hypothetical protein
MTYAGTADPVPAVRRRAFAVLIKLAQDCQPGVAEFHSTLLPRVFDALADDFDEIAEEACMALDEMVRDPQFGEDGGIAEFLDLMVERLFALRSRSTALHGESVRVGSGMRQHRRSSAPSLFTIFSCGMIAELQFKD